MTETLLDRVKYWVMRDTMKHQLDGWDDPERTFRKKIEEISRMDFLRCLDLALQDLTNKEPTE